MKVGTNSSRLVEQLHDQYQRMHEQSTWMRAYRRKQLGEDVQTGVIMHINGPFSRRCSRWLAVNEEAWLRLEGGSIVESYDPSFINLALVHPERQCGVRNRLPRP